MAKQIIVGIALAVLFSPPGWSQSASPSMMATPPQPSWSDLSVPQKIILAPLCDEWDSMESYRQKKWLSIAARFPSLNAVEQRRMQGQMQEWRKLTPEQRQMAREAYKTASKLPADKKHELLQKWEEYSSLPEEEKQKLKQQAARKSTPAILPGTATTGKRVQETVLLPHSSAQLSELLPPPAQHIPPAALAE